jgi:hypothetical protein
LGGLEDYIDAQVEQQDVEGEDHDGQVLVLILGQNDTAGELPKWAVWPPL